MPVTIVDVPVGSIAKVNARFIDQADETARKITRLASVGVAGNINALYNAMLAMTHAGVIGLSATQTINTALDGEPNVTLSGLYTLVNLRLVLGFEREHPLNPAKTITAGFSIPAPVNTIVSATNPKRPLAVRGVTFAAAATDPERLGAIIDYLETALVYKAADDVDYIGGWTYVESRSGLAAVSGVIDGDIRT